MSHSPRYAPGSSPLRRVGLIAALLLAALALTGCVTVQLKANVHSDGTVSGTTRIGIAKSLATLGGGSAADALAELKSQNSCDFGGRGVSKDFDDGTYIGIDCAFSGVTLAQFNAGADGPKLVREGDHFHLSGRINLLSTLGGLPATGGTGSIAPTSIPTDLSSLLPSGFPTDLSSLLPSGAGLPSGLDPSTLLKTAKISFEFSFPGKVSASAGKVHGHSVTFTPDATGTIDFETTAAAQGSAGVGSTAWIGLTVLALVLLSGLALLLRRRRATPAQPAFAGYTGYGGAPGGAPYPPAEFGPGYSVGQSYPPGQYPPPQYPPPQYQPPPPYQQPQYQQPAAEPSPSAPPPAEPSPWAPPPAGYPDPAAPPSRDDPASEDQPPR
ncbi:MAG: LppM family (lipo)protein [Jatrophihabitans sp.]